MGFFNFFYNKSLAEKEEKNAYYNKYNPEYWEQYQANGSKRLNNIYKRLCPYDRDFIYFIATIQYNTLKPKYQFEFLKLLSIIEQYQPHETVEPFKHKAFGLYNIVSIGLYNFVIPYPSNKLLRKKVEAEAEAKEAKEAKEAAEAEELKEPEKAEEVRKGRKIRRIRQSGRKRVNKWDYIEYINLIKNEEL